MAAGQQFLGDAIRRMRERLLDLTLRNRLLDYRFSKRSTLRFVDCLPDNIHRRLLDREKLLFQAVPEPTWVPPDPKPEPKVSAETLSWNISFELPQTEAGRGDAPDGLPTLRYKDDLLAICRRIATIEKTAIEESGISILYLIFGFLQWREFEDSDQVREAPLILMPVKLERDLVLGEHHVSHAGEDCVDNMTLREKLRLDFGLMLPELADEETPSAYWERVSLTIVNKPRWRVSRGMALGTASFAKLRMYKDLDPDDPALTGHALIERLFGAGDREEQLQAGDHDTDQVPEPLNLVFDADGSQENVLLDARQSKNLAVEGPPGTGKSQTITNLIADALQAGKKVLFVAEKLAAMEVVKRRLDEANLGQYCLELHSHKADKRTLYAGLRARLGAEGFERTDLTARLNELKQSRDQLLQYIRELHSPISARGETLHQTIWARDRYLQELGDQVESVASKELLNAEKLSNEEFSERDSAVVTFSQRASGVLRSAGGSIMRHPWYGAICINLLRDDYTSLFASLEELKSALQDLENAFACLTEATGFRPSTDTQFHTHLVEIKRLSSQDSRYHQLLNSFTDREVEEACLIYASDISELATTIEDLRRIVAQPEILLNASLMDALQRATTLAQGLGMLDRTPEQIEGEIGRWARNIQVLTTAISSIERSMQALGIPPQATLRICRSCINLADLLGKYPVDWVAKVRDVRFDRHGLAGILERARIEAERLPNLRDELARDFDLQLARIDGDLRMRASTLRGANLWERWFGGDYRRAKKLYRRLRLTRPPRDRYQMADGLTQLAEFFDHERDFEENKEYRDTFGNWWQGVGTDFPALKKAIDFHSVLRAALPPDHAATDTMRNAVLQVSGENLRQCGEQLAASLATLRVVLSALTAKQLSDDKSFTDMAAANLGHSQKLSELLSTVVPAGLLPSITVGVLLSDGVLKGRRGIELKKAIGGNEIGHRECGEAAVANVAEIRTTVCVSRALRDSSLAPELQSWLRHAEYTSRRNLLEGLLARVVEKLDLYIACRQVAIAKAGLDIRIWFPVNADLQTTRQRIENALGKRDDLRPWTLYIASRNENLRLGLALCVEDCEAGRVAPEQAPALFRLLYHNSVARAAIRSSSLLAQFEGSSHDEVRRRFASLDKEIIEARRKKLAYDIYRAYRPVPGVGNGPVGNWTEWPLLSHQLGLERPRLATRKLMERAGKELQALKPCFMMSPLSVAQYLPLGTLSFDLVVMDEASQLRPEDALGAVARGGQLIVVGDSKQLPPTTFFQRVAVDDDEPEELTAPEDVESILAAARSAFQTRDLRWHYRSQHHSLIAFSNLHFYDGSLTVFPSAYENDAECGVRDCFVRGRFNEHTNPQEAIAIVDALIDHAENRPHESVGVATMNFEQQEYIEELLEKRLRNNPFGVTFAERMQIRKEPLFIKNLENVQGDERDVILISMTYGPREPGGPVPQRFGPINTELGWRRLNVLFTRARKRVLVFRSLEPEDINLTPGRTSGLPAFRGYLAYAKGEPLQRQELLTDRESNEFELSVAREVEKFNVKVVPQVGVAGYFVDLAVEHPNDPGRYILGIECDGATYHSARSVRERDRLREEILTKSYRWAIHRIWSTEWFHDRKKEIERLRKRIEHELHNAKPVDRPLGIAPLDQRLRKAREQLCTLRDRIRHLYPYVSAEREVLRDDHLDRLLDKRPVTLEEWQMRIDRPIRESLDSAQWRAARDEIFEILQELRG